MTIHLISADHLSQGLDVVARLGANPRRLGPDLLAAVPGLRGVLVLATCNRLAILLDEDGELPAGAGEDAGAAGPGAAAQPGRPLSSSPVVREASTLLERRAGLPEGSAGLSAARGSDAYRELIATAAGLRSMVVGEREIAGQLRRSLVRATEEGTTSADLCRLVERASAASRRVARETSLAGAGRSLVAVGLGLASQRMPDLEGARVVVVGTGAYAGATVVALRERGVRDIAVHSHSDHQAAQPGQESPSAAAGPDRAAAFARKRGLEVVGHHELTERLASADLVITCRGLGSPVITRGLIDDALAGEPGIGVAIREDLRAVLRRDPACRSYSTPLLFFKGFHALQSYRVAHHYWVAGRTVLALYLQSRISEVFAVDIHPGARIGKGIMFDHATSVVIGETAVVEDDFSMLHEVTLGGTGKIGGDRHPKIGRGVVIGAGAKVLGSIRVGEGAQVGAGSVVLRDVPAHATVVGVPAKVVSFPIEDSPSDNDPGG